MFRATRELHMSKEDIIDVYYHITTLLNIDNPPKIEIVNDMRDHVDGRIYFLEDRIMINLARIKDNYGIHEVICHELAHIIYHSHSKAHKILTLKYCNQTYSKVNEII